jgi:hypothetical protein
VLEHSALAHSGRVLGAFELERDRRLDLLVEANLQQVHVLNRSAHRIALLIFDDHRLAPTAVELDVEEGVPFGQHRAQAAA